MSMLLILLIITCICFFLLAFISLANPAKVNIIANRWLALFFAAIGCMLLNAVIQTSGMVKEHWQLIGFNELSRFAMAPALYLSIVQFTTPGSRFRPKHYLHFIPFGLFLLYMVPALYFPGHYLPGHQFVFPAVVSKIMAMVMFLSVKVQLLVYWLLSFFRLRQHQKNIQLINSNTSPVNLNWLRYMLMVIGAMLMLFYLTVLFGIRIAPMLIPLGYLAGSLTILYYSLAQKEIYPFQVDQLEDINTLFADTVQDEKSAKKRFTNEQALLLQAKLEHLMTNEKIYLDNELSLPQLAEIMKISVHDLSYLLNEQIGVSFFQFINLHRVEEAKQLMAGGKYKHLNILGIAYSSGFNSKTTFNTTFKKHTGISPSQFIQQLNDMQGAPSTI